MSVSSDEGIRDPRWTAPELLSGSVYTRLSDVYSYGIVLWEICSRKTPFGEKALTFIDLEKTIIKGARPLLTDVEPAFKDTSTLCEKCWDPFPLMRPDFHHVAQTLREVFESDY